MQRVVRFTEIPVRAGKVCVSDDKDKVLAAIGLGSCVSVIAFDHENYVGGIAHIQLPDSKIGRFARKPNSNGFADIGIPELLRKMEALGAFVKNVRVALAGGAQLGEETNDIFQVGQKNQRACKTITSQLGLRILEKRLGGNEWRSVRLFVNTGQVRIQTQGKDVELITLSPCLADQSESNKVDIAIRGVGDIELVLSHLLNSPGESKRKRSNLKNVKEIEELLSHMTKG